MLLRLLILTMLYAKVKVKLVELFPAAEYGAVWPKPVYEKQNPTVYLYDPAIFKIGVTHHNCDLIQKAILRFKTSMNALVNNTKGKRLEKTFLKQPINGVEMLKGLRIVLRSPCENNPHHKMDESCGTVPVLDNITVSKISQLTSESIWGIIRGMESFSQLFSLSSKNRKIFLRAMEIFDRSRYPHRGLMLDTSRQYIPVTSIIKTLHTMAMHKLNVFHWRVADDGSLINKIAGRTANFYSKTDIKKIIDHARTLGIRVTPEFDLPIHTGPINNSMGQEKTLFVHPFSKITYYQLEKLYGEVHSIFPEKYIHLGEVDLSNWMDDPKIKQYVEAHHSNINELHYLYLKKVYDRLGNGSIPIVWQSSKDVENNLPSNFIIQAERTKRWFIRNIKQILKGRQLILFIGINQKHLLYIKRNRYEEYYEEDLRTRLFEITNEHSYENNILGLETIIEPDVLDKNGNIMRSAWIAISAIAEVLWSNTDGKIPDYTLYRMAEQDCRLNLRGAYTGVTDFLMYKSEEAIPESALRNVMYKRLNTKQDRDMKEWDLLAYSLISRG